MTPEDLNYLVRSIAKSGIVRLNADQKRIQGNWVDVSSKAEKHCDGVAMSQLKFQRLKHDHADFHEFRMQFNED